MKKFSFATFIVVAAALLAGGVPAGAAKKPSCMRGQAKLVASSGDVRVVRVTVKKRSKQETRRQHVLACWTKTGKRVTVNTEVDFGLDNIARTAVQIVGDRYVGVVAQNEGGVSESLQSRVYDARTQKLLHDSKACEEGDTDDHVGVDDVAFLDGGGMAMACNKLLVFRKAASEMETLEPEGTWVQQLGVSHYSFGSGQRLFWVISDKEFNTTTKSIAL
jgi:hypothetical protein